MAYQPRRESPDGDNETHRQEATDWGAADGAADRLETDADQEERADREAAPGGFSEAAASEFLRRVVHDVETREEQR